MLTYLTLLVAWNLRDEVVIRVEVLQAEQRDLTHSRLDRIAPPLPRLAPAFPVPSFLVGIFSFSAPALLSY